MAAVPLPQSQRLPAGRRPARPRLRTVRAPASRRRTLPFLLMSAVLVVGLILTLTSVQALLAQGAFRLSTLGQQAEKLEIESDMLRLKLARLSSPERVAAAARRSGLVEPGQIEILDGP